MSLLKKISEIPPKKIPLSKEEHAELMKEIWHEHALEKERRVLLFAPSKQAKELFDKWIKEEVERQLGNENNSSRK